MSQPNGQVSCDDRVMLETWRRYYDGPNAGTIDVETARREVPSLLGTSVPQEIGGWKQEPPSHSVGPIG